MPEAPPPHLPFPRSAAIATLVPFAILLTVFIVARSHRPRPAPAELHFDGPLAFRDLEALVSTFGPRPAVPPRSRLVADWIVQRFKAEGFSAELATGVVDGTAACNAVATLPGASDRYLVVLGHHDSVNGAPGAEDNASAVAALFGLARALKGRALRHTVILCATDAEETGGAGAELCVEWLGKDKMKRVDACIGLEMLAWPGGSPVMHALPKNYALELDTYVPAGLPATLAAASPESLPLGDPYFPLLVQSFTRSVRAGTGSDDIYFLREGVPSLFLSRSSLTRFYPHYHAPSDEPAALSAEALQSSGRILEAGVLALDAGGSLRDGPKQYLLVWGAVLTKPNLLLIALGASLPVLVFGWARKANAATMLVALPPVFAVGRFHLTLFLATWTLAAVWPLLCALSGWKFRTVFLLSCLPGLAILGVWLSGFAMFGASLSLTDSLLLFTGLACALTGSLFRLGRPPVSPAPTTP